MDDENNAPCSSDEPGKETKTYLSDKAGMRAIIPIGCTGWAIAAGYCGLFSIIPCLGLILSILSIVFGILAIRTIRTNPHKHGIARIVIGWVFAIPSLTIHLIYFLAQSL